MKAVTFETLEQFLSHHTIKKDSTQELTHTEFGKTIKRTFHIPNDTYDQYMKLYYKDVIKPKRTRNIIERQLIFKSGDSGPLLLDVDLQFLDQYTTRQYTSHHLYELVQCVLTLISDTFEMDDDINFIVAVQEKPAPRTVTKPNSTVIVKDGIHLIFSISIDKIYHQYFRQKIIEAVQKEDMWKALPISNGFEDVFDSSISNGTNGWLAPFSMKPDDKHPYDITLAYNVNFDTEKNTWSKIILVEKVEQVEAFYKQYYKQLFVRNQTLPKLSLPKESALNDIKKFQDMNKKLTSPKTNIPMANMGGGDEMYQISINTIRQIRNKDDLEMMKNIFLDHLDPQKYEIKEAFEFAMTLPETYYGSGSYNKWIKVGFALRNTSIYLLIGWVVFSAQSSSFDFTENIGSMCDHWMRWVQEPEFGVTRLSLMYWSKHDAPEKYQKVHENTVDFYLDQTIGGLSLEQLTKKGKGTGCSDYDIATVVYHLKKGLFIACGIKSNSWYVFNGSYWSKDDSGTTLRNILSTQVRGLYIAKSTKLWEKAHQIKTPDGEVDTENEKHQLLKARANLFIGIATRLGNTHEKDNFMRECKEQFYDKDFEKKLDQNRYLLCFSNGVIDFKEKRFRKGYPEDYISKCTQIDYVPVNRERERDREIITEIQDYFNKLFPIPELCAYMWNHLASVIIGDTAKTQCLHYYTGVGQNGKSMLVKLIQMMLGDYATELDVSFFVNERPSRGKATPELLCLLGTRFAVTAEPSEGEKLNEGPMKALTSGTDRIKYRGLFKDEESFLPQVHSVIMANHYLPVKSRDHGTWRRIRVVKFLSLFVDTPDPTQEYQFKKEEDFDDKFAKWAPIFISLLVEKAFVNQGSLRICKIVEDYSMEYKKGQDYLAEFIADKIEKSPGSRLKKMHVLETFNEWYFANYREKISGKKQELYNTMDKAFGACVSNCWLDVKIKIEYDTIGQQSLTTHETNSEAGTTTSELSA